MSEQSTGTTESSLSSRYESRTPQVRRYLTTYALFALGFGLFGGATNLLLSLHVQSLEFARIFTGPNATADIQKLTELQAAVNAHTATATASQQHLLNLLTEFNTSKASGLSVVFSIAVFVTMIFLPIVGLLSDNTRSRWGRRVPWMLGGTLAGAAILFLLPLSPNIAVLVVLYSLVTLTINSAQAVAGATVADRVPQDRIGLASALTGGLAYLGAVVGALVAGTLFTIIGLAAYFPYAIIVVVVALIFSLVARDKSTRDMIATRLHLKSFFLAFVSALRDSDFRFAWIAKVLLYTGYAMSTGYAVYMLESYIRPFMNTSQAAVTAPLITFVGFPFALIGIIIVGRWSDKIRRRKPFVIAASAIMAVSFLIPFVWATLPAMFIQSGVMSIGFGAFIVVDQALFIEVLPNPESAGRDLGLAGLGLNLGQALGPAFAGVIVTVFAGAYGPIWLVACLMVLVATALIIPIKRVR
ncbi:MAG: Major Facilitator Superfamily [Microbacteriaceae bacterium]|nr:Major Facilitator Superfamily [Microbacteriaceae bacterium]